MTPLVSPAWLAQRLTDPSTIVLDATMPPVGVTPPVDTRARYLEQHIPGAIFFDIDQLSDHSTPLPHMLPTAADFAAAMSALGISDTATIVVYEQQGVYSAPRARWMLRTFGTPNVYLLDGGLPAWLSANLPAESGPVTRAATTFHARLDATAINDLAHIREIISAHGQISRPQILDARSNARFTGAAPEPRPNLSSGHMPGATSMPFLDLVTPEGRLKSPEELRAIFSSRHVDLAQPITTTCGSGVTAAVVSLGLELAGATKTTLYDGSWAEYASQPDAVIEKNP
jgi:thiosulfate/3-mercaptopyruvate sulfurtransferase